MIEGAATWSNQEWVEALGSEGARSAAAHTALLGLLQRGLRRAFASRPEALELIDDFAQDASIRIIQQISAFRGDSRFVTWAMAIAVRVVFDELRRKRWRDVSLEALSASGFEAQDRQEGNPEKAVTRKRVLNELRTALQDSLSAKQALALTAEMKGMPLREIGARMSSNRNAIYKLTYDARKILKRVLSERGITAETIAWAFADEEEGAV